MFFKERKTEFTPLSQDLTLDELKWIIDDQELRIEQFKSECLINEKYKELDCPKWIRHMETFLALAKQELFRRASQSWT